MIYHCEDHTCNYWDEGEKLPERCPQCGRKSFASLGCGLSPYQNTARQKISCEHKISCFTAFRHYSI